MAYFVGRGYSGAFTAHMAALLEELRPDSLIRLTVGTDAVCSPCPNNAEGLCDKPELTAAYDRAVLQYCGLAEGETIPFGQFTSLVQKEVLGKGLRKKICGNCQWDGICSAQPSRWVKNE